jgi:hypothetical protein
VWERRAQGTESLSEDFLKSMETLVDYLVSTNSIENEKNKYLKELAYKKVVESLRKT